MRPDSHCRPGSPLVVYGDTTQDGVWYSGAPGDNLGMEFGPKPFDPFTHIPDGQNEDDEWVFGLANPYDHSGNDIIDASGLFADLLPANLPTVGFTAYGASVTTSSSAARPAITSRAARATTRSAASAASTTSTATPVSTSTS